MTGESNEWAAYQTRTPPTEAEWDEFVSATPVGSVLAATVLSHHPFGFFVDLGFGLKCIGLVEIPNIADTGVVISPADYPPVGSRIDRALVLDHTPRNHQARLTIRPIDLDLARPNIELVFGADGELGRVAADVGRVLDLSFQLRESMYFGGAYYRAEFMLGTVIVQVNKDPDDPLELDHPDVPVIVRVDGSLVIEHMVVTAMESLGLVFIRRNQWGET